MKDCKDLMMYAAASMDLSLTSLNGGLVLGLRTSPQRDRSKMIALIAMENLYTVLNTYASDSQDLVGRPCFAMY